MSYLFLGIKRRCWLNCAVQSSATSLHCFLFGLHVFGDRSSSPVDFKISVYEATNRRSSSTCSCLSGQLCCSLCWHRSRSASSKGTTLSKSRANFKTTWLCTGGVFLRRGWRAQLRSASCCLFTNLSTSINFHSSHQFRRIRRFETSSLIGWKLLLRDLLARRLFGQPFSASIQILIYESINGIKKLVGLILFQNGSFSSSLCPTFPIAWYSFLRAIFFIMIHESCSKFFMFIFNIFYQSLKSLSVFIPQYQPS